VSTLIEITELDKIERALTESRMENGVAGFRATTLNLVVHAANRENVESALTALAELGASHPLRAIIALAADRGPVATVSSTCFAQGGEHNMWCTEQIILEARAEALPSAVTSLLLPDLPVFLWWQGTTASGGRVMRPLAEAASRLVVNSDECGLDRLAELDLLRPALTDLAWSRLTPWREGVARLFDAPTQRDALGCLDEVEIRGPENEAWLMCGWLRSRLGRPVPLVHKDARRMASIVLRCGDRRFTVRRLKNSDQGRMSAPGVPEKTLLLEDPPLAALLAAELDVFGRDLVFEEALAAAREDR
jgi:glucose-6-phosphate dehydrogenase assembly protein OpcA